jgi:hypothetical protein
MLQLLGGIFVFIVCPLLGGFPFQRLLRQHKLSQRYKLFQHDKQWQVAIVVLQGLMAVGVTKLLFPFNPEWEIMALMGLAAGRFWMAQSGGVWSTIAGYGLHDPLAGLLVALFGLIGTTVFRQNRQITSVLLILMPLMTALLHSRSTILILLTAGLSGILFGMEQKQPVKPAHTQFKLFRADSLDDDLSRDKVGQLAFVLSQLKQADFPVPIGWIFYPGDDPQSLPAEVQPSLRRRWLVRSSFVTATASSQVIDDLMSVREIWGAIVKHFEAHARSADSSANMAVIIQPQIASVFSGTTNCEVPMLKADVPSEAAQAVLGFVDRLKIEFPDIQMVEWIFDGEQVWIVNVDVT